MILNSSMLLPKHLKKKNSSRIFGLRPFIPSKSCISTFDKFKQLNTFHDKNVDRTVYNRCGIEMIPDSIHQQVFGKSKVRNEVPPGTLSEVQNHLSSQNLWGRITPSLENFNLQLPPLQGDDLSEHFLSIAEKQLKTFKENLLHLISNKIPPIPKVWNMTPGWTCYNSSGESKVVDFPDEDAYVFDVEVCVKEGHSPTLATAVSNKHWYSWCSNQLFTQQTDQKAHSEQHYTLENLINLETSPSQDRLAGKDQRKRIVIGHNVSYDRARVKEQYFLDGTQLRFLDTMAMHIAVSGMTNYQRSIHMTGKNDTTNEKPPWKPYGIMGWQNVSSMNGLGAVYKLYCGRELDKEKRNIFVTRSLEEIKEDFQSLVTYCARDTRATYQVLQKLFPEYLSRFPHPVTLAGVLEIGTTFLPVNRSWKSYLKTSEETFNELERDLSKGLKMIADQALRQLSNNQEYKTDPWLWDLDWSTRSLKIKKSANKTSTLTNQEEDTGESLKNEAQLDSQFQMLMESKDQLFKINPLLPGYPSWYRSLCNKDEDGLANPSEMSLSSQIVPKLLKLTWDGYPLFRSSEFGWGYLVPGRPLEYSRHYGSQFPLPEALRLFPIQKSVGQQSKGRGAITVEEASDKFRTMTSDTADPIGLAALWKTARSDSPKEYVPPKKSLKEFTPDRPAWHQGIGPYDVGIPGCWFFRLPHKDGPDSIVGNPLAKDFLKRIEDGTLRSAFGSTAEHILHMNLSLSYWKNMRERILSQMVVWLDRSQLPNYVSNAKSFDPAGCYGAILPQVVATGTLTRRAVESTWMTASYPQSDRLGSEFKAMVQCPPGMSMVGADISALVSWIASVIGDAHFAGLHGSTALGWITLQGNKQHGTDLHSRIASALSISRDQAKVLNYGRIYGGGERFTKALLMQFDPQLSDSDASKATRQLYSMTKGEAVYQLNDNGRELAHALGFSLDKLYKAEELKSMCASARLVSTLAKLSKMNVEELTASKLWAGGTESAMFNKLEQIAQSDSPETPVLRCRISRALEPRNVGKEFMSSRLSWVVQSSAVDYLHLMLVAVRHLFDVYRIKGRFCISIHDEIRYLVKDEDRFRAALALQIANLWTRSMFSYRLGLTDLPKSVAFFPSVGVDSVLRKETNADCRTPSNPFGLEQSYGVPLGETYGMREIMEQTRGSLEPSKQL